jgi:hypothetical protein
VQEDVAEEDMTAQPTKLFQSVIDRMTGELAKKLADHLERVALFEYCRDDMPGSCEYPPLTWCGVVADTVPLLSSMAHDARVRHGNEWQALRHQPDVGVLDGVSPQSLVWGPIGAGMVADQEIVSSVPCRDELALAHLLMLGDPGRIEVIRPRADGILSPWSGTAY